MNNNKWTAKYSLLEMPYFCVYPEPSCPNIFSDPHLLLTVHYGKWHQMDRDGNFKRVKSELADRESIDMGEVFSFRCKDNWVCTLTQLISL